MEAFNLSSLVGVTGAPVIEQGVEYLKEQWGLPAKLAALAAVALGVILNIALGFYFHFGLVNSIMTGLLTGFVASGWHEISKS